MKRAYETCSKRVETRPTPSTALYNFRRSESKRWFYKLPERQIPYTKDRKVRAILCTH